MPEDRLRILVACGAAGGIAATFNAPITGVFFGVEIILREFSIDALFTVMLSAMVADVIGREFLGSAPFLSGFPAGIDLRHARTYLLIAVLAVIAALIGLAFSKAPGRPDRTIRPAPHRRSPSDRTYVIFMPEPGPIPACACRAPKMSADPDIIEQKIKTRSLAERSVVSRAGNGRLRQAQDGLRDPPRPRRRRGSTTPPPALRPVPRYASHHPATRPRTEVNNPR